MRFSLEQFKLLENGDEIRVEIDHVFADGETLKLVKRLERVHGVDAYDNIEFLKPQIVNNWVQPHNHSVQLLQKTRVKVVGVIEYTAPTTQYITQMSRQSRRAFPRNGNGGPEGRQGQHKSCLSACLFSLFFYGLFCSHNTHTHTQTNNSSSYVCFYQAKTR